MVNLTVVLDIGQFTTKAGFGGENEPRAVFYSMTGTPKYTAIGTEAQRQVYVGEEVIDAMGLYKVIYPIEHGEINNWEMFKALMDYAFYRCQVDPSSVNVLFTTNPFLSRESKRKLFKLFLEEYQVMGYYPVRGALLTMYSGGFDTGLVVDVGAANIRITPIFQGFVIHHAVQVLDIGGQTLDQFMIKKLQELGVSMSGSVHKELARILKEQACFTSLSLSLDLKNHEKLIKKYALPDGSTIELGAERCLIPELIFDPSLNELEIEPLPIAIANTIELCDIDIRKELMENIFITGGSSMFPFFTERLTRELEQTFRQRGYVDPKIHIIAPRDRVLSNWVGGSILAMLPEFQNKWITRKQYFQEGIPDGLLDA